MECKYVRQTNCLTFVFHPNTTSIFTLMNVKNRLRIMQENLYTGLIINQFTIPLREGNLQVDNYSLEYNQEKDLIVLTLLNHMMIFSVAKRKLLMVAQAQGKHPYFIQKMLTKGDYIYFTATEQKNIYSISISDSIKNGSITNYNKFKITAEVEALDLAISDRILVAICNDKVIRVWNLENGNPLKGAAIEGIGMPICIKFSKNYKYLLIGTSDGATQAWDGKSLGIKNTNIMTQKITNMPIQSVCWFHYSGQMQSNRFLILTQDGNVKLYSFWFDKKDNAYIGKASQLSLLYINKNQISPSFMIQSHSFANFIFFSPGILLFMVDSFPLIYYPVIVKQQSLSFEQLTPNKKKQVYYQRDILFMQNLDIKRVKDTIQQKLSLSNQLEYSQLKIIKLEMRPLIIHEATLKSKLMLFYHLSKNLRILTISNLNLNQKSENLATYKEYSGSWVMFLGPSEYYQPFIFIVQEDRQTITVLSQNNCDKYDLDKISDEEKRYYNMGAGQIYTKKINIKVQRVYGTPFRDNYVVLYQSENLLRFSNNVNYDTQLINYDVFTGISLRLDYTEIIMDVVWTKRGEMGAVICLDKVVFINSDLKIMRSVYISGYIVQGQWIGYTLMITTKKDVQYLDILGKPQQAYCLQNMQNKYLVLKVMADRIFGIEKIQEQILVKARYFNIMQPLISGYLNYLKVIDSPIDQEIIKRIIESYAPYFIVNENFIQLLNERNLANISKYFIEGNEKMYSRPLRAKVLNDSYRIDRFVPKPIWLRNKRHILDLFLSFEEAKDSLDSYEKQKGQKVGQQLKNLIGVISFDSIKNIAGSQSKGISIATNFGQKSLVQLYYDVNTQGEPLRMEIEPFKAQNAGQWLGKFGSYIQSHVYFSQDAPDGEKEVIANFTGSKTDTETSNDDDQFKDLVVYYRIDDGKGTVIDDLSNFGNDGSIQNDQSWTQLQSQPMQLEDKWGKKCPPQYSLATKLCNVKKIKSKSMSSFSVQIWIRPMKQNFFVANIQGLILISFVNLKPIISIKQNQCNLKQKSEEVILPSIGSWTHFCCSFSNQTIKVYFNSQQAFEGLVSMNKKLKPISLQIGEENLEYTQFRLWKISLEAEDIRDNLRTPLGLVAQKRKTFKMKLKEKKKKQAQNSGFNPNAFL